MKVRIYSKLLGCLSDVARPLSYKTKTTFQD